MTSRAHRRLSRVDYKAMASGKSDSPCSLTEPEAAPAPESVLDSILIQEPKSNEGAAAGSGQVVGDEIFYDPDSYHLDSSGGETDTELACLEQQIAAAVQAKEERRVIRAKEKARKQKKAKILQLPAQLLDLQNAGSSDSEAEPPSGWVSGAKHSGDPPAGSLSIRLGLSDLRQVISMENRRREKSGTWYQNNLRTPKQQQKFQGLKMS